MRKCRICGENNFKKVIDFGKNPLVNSLLEKKDLDKPEKVYPLVVEQCQSCFLVQIVEPIDSKKIYQDQDYLYYTGDMPQNSEYIKSFDSLVEEIEKKHSKQGDLIVEIGSNDGFVLKKFKKRNILGVDPSTNIVIRALKNGVPTLCAPFNEHNAKNIASDFGQAQVIGGANCLAHIDNIKDVMRGVNKLLLYNGIFWAECNYWGGMVKSHHYALIYHDHYSYFTLKNWVDLLKQFGMKVFDAYITNAQGKEGLSLRLYACRNQVKKAPTKRFIKLITKEKNSRLNSYKTAQKFEKSCRKEAQKLKKVVESIKTKGKTIAGYGAAAKGFSVLKLAGIDQRHLDFFIDDSPAKQGKYTPITHIPIISRKEANLPDYFFITAPNYEKVIIEKERKAGFQGKFLTIDSRII